MLRRLVVATGSALAATLLLAGTAVAQTGVLSGAVFAGVGGSKTGLEGATIYVVGTDLTGVTGKDGRFTIANVPAGDVEIRIRRAGYVVLADRVRIAASDTTTGYYGLLGPDEDGNLSGVLAGVRKRVTIVDGVVVDAEKQPDTHARITIGTADGRLALGTGLGEKPPLIIVDGVIMSDESMRDLDPHRIEKVEVVKGEAAVSAYGSRGTNGVIMITTKKPPQI